MIKGTTVPSIIAPAILEEGTKETILSAAKKAEELAEEAVDRPWVRALSRGGFVAKGVLFVVIGLSAILLGAGIRGGRITDPVGAMAAISQMPLGTILLSLLSLGAVGHGAWNILRGIADIDETGTGIKGIIARSAAVGIGIFYLILAVTAIQVIVFFTGRVENGRAEETIAWLFLSIPLGAVIILLIALGFLGAAAHECYSGFTGKFRENYHSWKLSPIVERIVGLLGVISFTTRAVLYVMIGYFFFLSANLNDVSQAQGMDGALLALAKSRFGSILLIVSGVGLLCHGILAFFEAKYRRIC